MAAEGSKKLWDPYETAYKRQFFYQPNSVANIFLKPMSTSFIDTYSQSGPFGSTVYSKDFSWKPACKTECIRTGTASGQRRNNPHPSQSFMMWRLPRDATRSSEYIVFPLKCLPSEEEKRKALTAQYLSTYRCDFMASPQGYNDIEKTARHLAPLHNRHCISLSTCTGMKANYCKPNQKPEVLGNLSHSSCKPDQNVAFCGIVPTVVQRHMQIQRKGSDLTTYGHFFGKRATYITSVMKSLSPQELQQIHNNLPEREREALRVVLRKDACPNSEEKINKLPAVVRDSCSP